MLSFATAVQEMQLAQNLQALVLGVPRMFMVVMISPFFSGTVLTGQLRMLVVMACYMVLHPMIVAQLPVDSGVPLALTATYAALLIKETIFGLLLGYLAGIMFWAIQSAGYFIDNQRGATMAAENDPLTGEQTSPLGSFLFQSLVYIFFSSGAFLTFLGLIYGSYEIWPVTELLPAGVFKSSNIPLFFAEKVGVLMTSMMLLSAPIVVACLLTDISLGLINRFASQLNVYVLAMPIKSAVSAFLLIFYFGMLMSGAVDLFDRFRMEIDKLRQLL